MRKILSALFSNLQEGARGGLLFVALVTTTCLWAYDFKSGDLYYNITSDTTVEIMYQYEWSSDNYAGLTTATIPETVTYEGTTYSVTSIGNSAFDGCSDLTSVTIPNSVTSIGNWAFDGCNKLTAPVYNTHCFAYMPKSYNGAYTIPDGIKQIAGSAFSGCSSLASLTIPNSVTSIGESAFEYCSSLSSIQIEATTPPTLGNSAFATHLTAIYIPDNTSSAYQQAWGNEYTYVNNETTLTLHVEVPGILEDLIFEVGTRPALVAKLILSGTLNDNDFTCMRETMTSLVDVDLAGITNTSGVDFRSKSKLVHIILPANLTSIGDGAFRSCLSLTSITIPNSVTSIGYSAFEDCRSLASITIPNSVTSIGNWAFSACRPLTSITIPNSVTSIGDGAFSACFSLTSITIPNSVTSIGSNAFSLCSSLTSITCLGTTPPDASDLGAYTTKCTLTVPQSAYKAYLRHTYWGSFLNINTGYLVNLQTNNTQWGKVTGDGLYFLDSIATITATPYDGYTFMRWSDGNTDNPRTIQVTSDTTLTAEFAIEGGCLVIFVDWDGTVLSSVSVVSGDAATAPADPIREGYTFIGWDKDFSVVADHMTITAQYQINRYRVRFFDDDTLLKTDSVEYQSAAIAPANPYHEGYTFTGWDQAFDSITSDLDVYAMYEMGEDREMTIVFTNGNDDSEIHSQTITIQVPAAPEIAGFTFLYWQPVAEPITNVITIQAIYEADIPTSAPEEYINPANPAQKLLRNGQVYILQDDKTYTIMGAKIQ